MKDTLQHYMQKILTSVQTARSRNGVGEHVCRDWFILLMCATLLFVVLVFFGWVRFHEVSEHIESATYDKKQVEVPVRIEDVHTIFDIVRNRGTSTYTYAPYDTDTNFGTSDTEAGDTQNKHNASENITPPEILP